MREEMQSSFSILNIDPTKDEAVIKRAYYALLKQTNPEEKPEEFKELRKAYELVLSYIAEETTKEDEPEEIIDDTPSGQWIGRVGELYKYLSKRTDTEEWNKLFAEDIFISLDGEEECKEKLLQFLMSHFFLPTEIWNIIGTNLQILKNREELLEKYAVNFIDFLTNKYQNGEDFEFSYFEGENDADYDTYFSAYNEAYRELEQKNLDNCEKQLKKMEATKIYHPLGEALLAHYFLEKKETEKALSIATSLKNRYAQSMILLYQSAEIFWNGDDKEHSISVYEQLLKISPTHYMANYRLAGAYYEKGMMEQAKKCADITIGFGADEAFYELVKNINKKMEEVLWERIRNNDVSSILELGWCYLQDQRFYKALTFIDSYEDKIPQEKQTELQGFLAKTYFEEGFYEKAIEYSCLWEKNLLERIAEKEDYEENLRRVSDAYYIRIVSYHFLGYSNPEYFDKSVSEYESFLNQKERTDRPEHVIKIHAAAAETFLDMERFEDVRKIGEMLIEKNIHHGYLLLFKAARMEKDANGVADMGKACIYYLPGYALSYEELCRLYRDYEMTDALKSVLERARENEVSTPYLTAYEYQLQNSEKVVNAENIEDLIKEFKKKYTNQIIDHNRDDLYQEGYDVLTEYFNQLPCVYLLNERGLYSMYTWHLEDAKKDFKQMLTMYPDDVDALNNLGCTYKYMGKYEKAIPYLKKAILCIRDTNNRYPYGNLLNVYQRMGDYKKAAEIYEVMKELFSGQMTSDFENDLILCYIKSNQPEKAKKEILKNTFISKNEKAFQMPEMWMKLNNFSEMKKAIEDCEKISKKKPIFVMSLYRDKAWYELLAGNPKEAVDIISQWEKSLQKNYLENKLDNSKISGYYEDMLFILMSLEEINNYQLRHNGKGGVINKLWLENGKKLRKKCAKEFKQQIDKDEKENPATDYQEPDRLYQRMLVAAEERNEAEMLHYYERLKKAQEKGRCCRCPNAVCLNMNYAEMILLEYNDKKEEMIHFCRELLEKAPYSAEAKMKIRLME